MKNKIRSLNIIFILLLLAGCAIKPDEHKVTNLPDLPPNPFEIEPNDVPDRQIGGFKIDTLNFHPFTDGSPLSYEGKPIEISFEVENGGPAKDVGLMLFVDGVVQPHKVIKSSQTLPGLKPIDAEQFLSVHDLSTDEQIQITVQFVPVAGRQGDLLSFNRMFMLKPSYLPSSENGFFGIFQSGDPIEFGQIELKVDAPTQANSLPVEVSAEPIPEVRKIDHEGNPTGRVLSPFFLFNDGSADYPGKVYLNEGKVKLRVQTGGGAEAEYRITIFINHIPVQINGHDSFLIRSKYDNVVTYEFELNLPGLPHLNSLYMIALPVSDGYVINPNSGAKSPSILLINSDSANTIVPSPSDPVEVTETQSGNKPLQLFSGDLDLSDFLIRNKTTSGDILFLSTLDDSTVFLAEQDQLFTIDIKTGMIKNETSLGNDIHAMDDDKPRIVNFFLTENGVAVLIHEVASQLTFIHYYDSLLNITKTINPVEILNIPPATAEVCAISRSGLLIACPDEKFGIVVANVETKERVYNYDLFAGLGNKKINVKALAILADDHLAFTGIETFDGTNSEVPSDAPIYGIIHLEQNRLLLKNAKHNLNDYRIQSTSNGFLFTERRGMVDRSDGNVVYYDLSAESEKRIPFSHDTSVGRESYTVTISPRGKFLCGIEYDSIPGLDGYQNVILRVYATNSHELIREIEVGSGLSFLMVNFTQNEDALLIVFSEVNNNNQMRLIKYGLQ